VKPGNLPKSNAFSEIEVRRMKSTFVFLAVSKVLKERHDDVQ
jgi:hypothetical protein